LKRPCTPQHIGLDIVWTFLKFENRIISMIEMRRRNYHLHLHVFALCNLWHATL
jgi:hypothetical protein